MILILSSERLACGLADGRRAANAVDGFEPLANLRGAVPVGGE
jgi:hypothetical protein